MNDVSPSRDARGASPDRRTQAPYCAWSSLIYLKPRLKRRLAPLAARLAHAGATANQVTITSIVGSLAVGTALCRYRDAPAFFAMLPLWLAARMALASIDGTLAIDHGQQSRLGGFLNEAGDIVSEVALFLPLAFVAPTLAPWVLAVIVLMVLSELAGIGAAWRGGVRRLDGSFGKADRSLALAGLGSWLAVSGSLPTHMPVLMLIFAVLLLVTIWNRLRFASAGDRA